MRSALLGLAILTLAASAGAHAGPNADLERLGRAIAERPSDAALRLERASVLRRLGRLGQAVRELQAVERLEPTSRALYLERAQLWRDRGDAKRALVDLDRYVGSGAPSVLALRTRAELLLVLRRPEEAWRDYDRAVALAPSPELVLARGQLDERRGNLERAARGYLDGLERAHGAVVIRLALIRVERARGRLDSALAHASALVASAGVRAEYLLLRAEIHDQAGRPEPARADRGAALAELDVLLRARSTALHHTARARALAALARRDEALQAARQALRLSPKYEPARALVRELSSPEGGG